jgi:hypothetical protein
VRSTSLVSMAFIFSISPFWASISIYVAAERDRVHIEQARVEVERQSLANKS